MFDVFEGQQKRTAEAASSAASTTAATASSLQGPGPSAKKPKEDASLRELPVPLPKTSSQTEEQKEQQVISGAVAAAQHEAEVWEFFHASSIPHSIVKQTAALARKAKDLKAKALGNSPCIYLALVETATSSS